MSKKNLKSTITKALAATLIITSINCGSVPVEAAKGKVTGISVTNLPASTLTLKKGKSKVLKVKVKTSGKGASKKYTVKSSKPKTVAVSKSGKNIKVKALKKGKAVITLTTKSGKKKAKVKVTVGTPASKMTISKTKATVSKNKTLALTAKITTKKVSNKKILWKSSNPKVATVDAKGVVKGITAGKATITALAADGSGVNKKCEVIVNNNVYIDDLSVMNEYSLKVTLSYPYKLSDDNFTVKSKRYDNGLYNRKCKINNITTSDNKTYEITIYDELYNADFVQVSVSGLPNGSVSKEARFMEKRGDYYSEEYYSYSVDSSIDKSLSVDGIGAMIISNVSGLPKGINVKMEGYYLKIKGKFTQAGKYNCIVKVKDELNYSYTFKLVFLIGDDNHLVAGAYEEVGVLGKDVPYDIDKRIYAIGGSGSYTYSIVGDSHGLRISGAYIIGEVKEPSKFNVTIKVQDANNSALSTTFNLPIEIRRGYNVSGMVKDLTGAMVTSCYVTIYSANPNDRFWIYDYEYTGKDGKYTYDKMLPAGIYTIQISKHGIEKYYFNVNISKNTTELNFVLPAYPVNVLTSDSSIPVDDLNWYDEDDTYVGTGSKIYLARGKRTLTTKTSVGLYRYSATINVNVPLNLTVKTTFKTESNVKGTLTLGQPSSISVDYLYNTYSFTPTESGNYSFYSTGYYDTYGYLFSDSGETLTSNDDGGDENNFKITYNLTAGKTYYLGARRYSMDANVATFDIIVEKVD